MRVTKKMLREAVHQLDYRIEYLAQREDPSELQKEYQRHFPLTTGDIPVAAMRAALYSNAVRDAIPFHWYR